MAIYSTLGSGKNNGQNPFGSLINLVMICGVIAVLWLILKGLLAYTFIITPILLLLTALINHKLVLDYFTSIGATFRKDVLMGTLRALFGIFTPFAALGLLLKALLLRKVSNATKDLHDQMQDFKNQQNQKNQQQQSHGIPRMGKTNKSNDDDYAEYEEIK